MDFNERYLSVINEMAIKLHVTWKWKRVNKRERVRRKEKLDP